ncbi:hypothetical protein D3C80_414700 [compost metagenome]
MNGSAPLVSARRLAQHGAPGSPTGRETQENRNPNGRLERAQAHHCQRAGARARPQSQLAASGRHGRRRHRRHRHPDPDRHRRGQGRAGRAAVLPDRGFRLRLRGPGLCRNGHDHPGLGQRLYLQLRRPGRGGGLDHRLEPDPGIQPGGQRRGGQLVRLRRAPAARLAGPAHGADAGAARRRPGQSAGPVHHRRHRRHADRRHAQERHAQPGPGGHQAVGPGPVRLVRPAPFQCGQPGALQPLRLRPAHGTRRRRARRHGGGGHHLLGLLRL